MSIGQAPRGAPDAVSNILLGPRRVSDAVQSATGLASQVSIGMGLASR